MKIAVGLAVNVQAQILLSRQIRHRDDAMIDKFTTVYAGHIDMPDRGKEATPANERRFSAEELRGVFGKLERVTQTMDRLGWHSMWMAEHHFQHEGYEVIPNSLMAAVHLCHITEEIKIGCGFNISPMWHPLRLAEDYAQADIMTKGRTIFGVGRGYHTREVETFGAPLRDQDANRELFEEQVEVLFKAFHQDSFSHKGKYYNLPANVPYRGYDLEEITVVPRPVNLPVECWQPVVSARPRGLDFMHKYGMKGFIGGGAATLDEGPIRAYQEAGVRAGKELELGEGINIGLHMLLGETKEEAIKNITPLFEEHAKLFGPLGFLPGLSDEQLAAIAQRGDWYSQDVPSVENYMKMGAWFAGTSEELIALIKGFEEMFPGLEYINLSMPMCTPESMMIEQYTKIAEEVMPHFSGGEHVKKAAAE